MLSVGSFREWLRSIIRLATLESNPSRTGLGLILVLGSLAANAQTQYCADDMVAPYQGFGSSFSASNIFVSSFDGASNYDDLLSLWETRSVNRHLGTGWTSFSYVRGAGHPSQNPQVWTWSGYHPGLSPPNRSGTANAYINTSKTFCPNGYTLHYGFYNGHSNTFYCEVEDKNVRACNTEPKPDKERGQCGLPMDGNPCNVASGNKYQVETDFTGVGPFPLRLERYYNSDLETPSTNLGDQWRHFYDRKIFFSTGWPHNTYHSGPAIAYLHRPNGQILAFVIDETTGDGTPRDSDTIGTLERNGDTYEYRDANDALEVYSLHYSSYWTRTEGRLEEIEIRGGYTQTLTYVNDLLDEVTDQFGRTLSFSYDTQDRITSVDDPNNRTYEFAYDTNGLLASVSYPDATPGVTTDNPKRHPGQLQ